MVIQRWYSFIEVNLKIYDLNWVHIVHSYKLTSARTFQILSSGNSKYGSKLNLTEAENNTGSWGMIVISLLNFLRSKSSVFMPSMNISPSTGANLNKADIIEDFPAPVRPTIPI